MKRFYFSLIAFLCCFWMAIAQDYTEKQHLLMEYPLTVLKEAQQALDVAMKDGNSVEVIDALMLLSAAQLQLDTDSFPVVANNIERVMNRCRNKVDRSVIALYLIDLYDACLSKDYYRYSHRSYVRGNSDWTTWSVQNFYDKTDSLQRIALLPERDLQRTSIASYRAIVAIEGGSDDDAVNYTLLQQFYPTMYDFVASIICRRLSQRRLPLSVVPQGCRYTSQDDFMRNSIAVPDTLVQASMWQVLGNVMRFHARKRQHAPLFMWNLQRLRYTHSIDADEVDYASALDNLIAQNSQYEYVIEAVIARYAHDVLTTTNDVRELYNTLMQWSNRYPRYYRTSCLLSLCGDMSAASVHISMPQVAYPNDSIVADIAYCNVDTIECVLWRCGTTTPMRNISYLDRDTMPWEVCASQRIVGKGVDFENYQVRSLFPSQPAGVYRLVVSSATHSDTLTFVVSPYMLLTIDSSPGEACVLLVDNKTGLPVADEEVVLTSRKGIILSQATTNADGLCRFDNPHTDNTYYVRLAHVEKYPFEQLLNFARVASERVDIEARIFTDRRLYRPGQTLQFSAIAYCAHDTIRQVVPNKTLLVKLTDNAGNEVWSNHYTTDKYGAIDAKIELPLTAAQGEWRLSISGDDVYAVQYIEVAEYKRPQFALSFNPVKGVYSYGDSVQVTGCATNYSGTAVAYAQVAYKVSRYSYWYGGEASVVAQGEVVTNAQGQFAITFVTTAPQEALARWWGTRYVVEVIVTSPAGESHKGDIVVTVSGQGVKFRNNIPSIISLDDKPIFDCSVVNGAGVEQAMPYNISLYRIYPNHLHADVCARDSSAMWQGDFSAGDNKVELPYSILSSGAYRLMMTTHTQAGDVVTDSVDFTCYSLTDKCPPVPAALWLPIDRYEVVNGDTVRIAVGSSLSNVVLYCFIANGEQPIEYRCVALDNSMTTIEFPFDATCDDVVQMQFVVIRNQEVHRRHVTIVRRQPDMRLIITPTTFRDRTTPGHGEKWQFTVRNVDGQPVDALFMTEMYDASLDALSSHSWYFNPIRQPSLRYYLSIDYMWNMASIDNAYLNYRNEYATAQYVASLVPYLHNYCVAMQGGYGYPIYRSMMKGADEYAVSNTAVMLTGKGAVHADALVPETQEQVAEQPLTQADKTSLSHVEYRTNMEETAFFYPHLVTNSEGNVCVEFTVPESNTTWNFLALAVSPQLYSGMFASSVVSSKPLMVQPNMPRFVRQGDSAVFSTTIYNATDAAMQGEAQITLYNPDDEKIIVRQTKPFDTPSGSSSTLNFTLAIPDTLSLVGVRVGASTPLYSDGEQHLLAVLPATEVVTEALPFYLSPNVCDTMITFEAMQEKEESGTVRNLRVTLEYCDNPAWYALTALPILAQSSDNSTISLAASLYAHVVAHGIVKHNEELSKAIVGWTERGDSLALTSMLMRNEELKQLLLSETPWLLDASDASQQLQHIASLLDASRTRNLQQELLDRLQVMQQADGGWPWFEGMQSSLSITLDVVAVLSRLNCWGDMDNTEQISMIMCEALRYLDDEYVRSNRNNNNTPDYQDLCYLYVRSALLDVPMSEDVLALQHRHLDAIVSEWYKYSEVEKAYAAVTLYRCGYAHVAEKIIDSLRQYAVVSSSQGMYWPGNRSYSFYRNSAIQVHCALYEAFEIVSPRVAELDAMRQWLLLQKQTQDWGAVPSTLDAVNILLTTGTNWLSSTTHTRIEWGHSPLPAPSQAEQIMGYAKYVRQGSDMVASDAEIVITEHADKPSWGALYWQYSDNIANIEPHATQDISLEREYYVERDGVLVPIDRVAVAVGDVVTVRLTIKTQRDMQYMTLSDYRPACFEPQEQLPRYNYSQGMYHYIVPGDATTNIYFEYMPRGVYVIEYKVYAERRGHYQAGVATLQSYYAPQFSAHTSGAIIAVGDK